MHANVFERLATVGMNYAKESHRRSEILLALAFLSTPGLIPAKGLPAGKKATSADGETTQNQRLEASTEPLSHTLQQPSDSESRIGPDDLLDITVFEAPDLNRTLRVSANGEISFQLLGAIKAGGLTPRQLALILQESLRRTYMKDPHVGVFVRELQSHPVSVGGAVKRPGVFHIRGTKTVLELLSSTEGLADDAGDTVVVIRGATGTDGDGQVKASSGADQETVASAPTPVATGEVPGEIVEINLKSLMDSVDPAFNLPVH